MQNPLQCSVDPCWDTPIQALVEAIPHVMFRKSSQVESDVLCSWPQQKKWEVKCKITHSTLPSSIWSLHLLSSEWK